MPIKPREELKDTFINGYVPTGADFCNVFDSYFHKNDDVIQIDANGNIGIDCLEPFVHKLEVCGNVKIHWNEDYNSPDDAEGALFLGDKNHYIKSVFGKGVVLKTYDPIDPVNRTFLFLQQGTGRLGIGTMEPDRPLSIVAHKSNGDQNEELISFKDTEGNTKWHINQKIWGIEGLNIAESNVADGRLFIKTGGNVGINSLEPKAQFQIGDRWTFHNGNNNKIIGYNQQWLAGELRRIKEGTASEILFSADGAIEFNTTGVIDGPNTSINYGNSVFKMANNGNVGIGISDPQERLHINGSIRGNLPLGALRIETDHGYLDLGSQNYDDWIDIQTDRDKFFFNKEINVASGKIGSHGPNDLLLGTDGDTKVRVKHNGRVAIGDFSPQAKLHIGSDGPHWSSWRKALQIEENNVIFFKAPGAEFGIGGKYTHPGVANDSDHPHLVLQADNRPLIYIAKNGTVTFKHHVRIDHPEISLTLRSGDLKVETGDLKLGTGNIEMNGEVVHVSDVRLKDNIADFQYGLEEICGIDPIWFNYRNRPHHNSSRRHIGISAQQIREIMPELIVPFLDKLYHTDVEETELYKVKSSSLIYITINAIKELNQKIEDLKQQIHEKDNN